MKKVLSFLLMTVLMLTVFRVPVHADAVTTAARAWVLYCVNNGTVLCGENIRERLPMASTTKVMTALLTLEAAAADNRVITFTDEMIAEGSSMYLQAGERVALDDLAVGMLMQSGNDAANAAAIALDGSLEAFAGRMNRRASELGMRDTHFVTPSGLDADGHRTTAYDMALLLAAAMENDRFRQISGQTGMTVHFKEPADKSVTYPNHNKLLHLYEGCIGGKTGYTDAAGRCLVTCAERDGLRLIAVTLDDPDDWDDHAALYDYGFGHYRLFTPQAAAFTVDVVGGTCDSVRVVSPAAQGMVIPGDAAENIRSKVYLPPFLYAPVSTQDEIGTITYYAEDQALAAVPLYPVDEIPYNSRRRGLIEWIKDLFHWHS